METLYKLYRIYMETTFENEKEQKIIENTIKQLLKLEGE